jgi:uncharacterized membrane protein (DUF373 family)
MLESTAALTRALLWTAAIAAAGYLIIGGILQFFLHFSASYFVWDIFGMLARVFAAFVIVSVVDGLLRSPGW